MKTLLERLSKEIPEDKKPARQNKLLREIEEALNSGYSLKQILNVLSQHKGTIIYVNGAENLTVPYTLENFKIFCEYLFK